jgi:hypothetical protein
MTHGQVVGVENAGGKSQGKATGLYHKHCKYSEQWKPWHPFQSGQDFQQAQSFSRQTKTCNDQHLRCGLDNFKSKSFRSANDLRKLLTENEFGLGDGSRIEDRSDIFGILYYWDIFKCIPFLSSHLSFQSHLDFEPVRLIDSESHRI